MLHLVLRFILGMLVHHITLPDIHIERIRMRDMTHQLLTVKSSPWQTDLGGELRACGEVMGRGMWICGDGQNKEGDVVLWSFRVCRPVHTQMLIQTYEICTSVMIIEGKSYDLWHTCRFMLQDITSNKLINTSLLCKILFNSMLRVEDGISHRPVKDVRRRWLVYSGQGIRCLLKVCSGTSIFRAPYSKFNDF